MVLCHGQSRDEREREDGEEKMKNKLAIDEKERFVDEFMSTQLVSGVRATRVQILEV